MPTLFPKRFTDLWFLTCFYRLKLTIHLIMNEGSLPVLWVVCSYKKIIWSFVSSFRLVVITCLSDADWCYQHYLLSNVTILSHYQMYNNNFLKYSVWFQLGWEQLHQQRAQRWRWWRFREHQFRGVQSQLLAELASKHTTWVQTQLLCPGETMLHVVYFSFLFCL